MSGLTNSDLLTEFDSLVDLVEAIYKMPEHNGNRNALVEEIVKLARGDWRVVQVEVRVRVSEFKERLGGLMFGEAVELVCCLKRLEQCEERVVEMIEGSRELRLWDLVREVKDKAGIEVYREEGKLRKETSKLRVSESDRFSARVLNSRDFLQFPSQRFFIYNGNT